jgi:quercetin dioxygenase-like cupin family protein
MSTSAPTAILLTVAALMSVAAPASAQQQPPNAAVTRTDLPRHTLPSGDFREVQAIVIELQPGAAAPKHRHDVAVLAYVLEGNVENQFDGGAVQVHRTGESWWESPGTVHDTARNASTVARARLLVVYIGETGKAQTVRLR